MNLKKSLLLGWALVAALSACKPDGPEIDPVGPPVDAPGSFPIGNPVGPQKTFTVTPAGGEFTVPENGLKLTIPPGAVTTATTISAQTVTATCPSGMGKSIRLLPHNVQFAKPVVIEFSYAALKDSLSSTNALSLAYQDEQGVWNLAMNRTVNETTQTVQVATTHFSDWSIATAVRLRPFSVTLSEKQEQKFQLIQYVKINSYEEFAHLINGDDLLAPLVPENVKVIYEGQPLAPQYVKEGSWELNSVDPDAEEGEINPEPNQSWALYKAPVFIPHPQSVGVSVAFNAKKGKIIFVANVELVPKNALVYRIGGGSWKTIHDIFVRKVKGEFAIGGFDDPTEVGVAILWTGNTGTYSWSEYSAPKNATVFKLSDIKNNKYYGGSYGKDGKVYDSSGSLVITKVGAVNESISGKFTVTPTGLAQLGQDNTTGPAIEGYFTVTRLPDSN